ncbi:MAG: N-acetylmuramoyl-L-alanine amidase [Clostridiales bacterium]|jgi:N-acetylmuramoyl-L-alanine amidase|nr:N-acetylmuramoyl-L-alanine amidase [Clostridiales bacterium]
MGNAMRKTIKLSISILLSCFLLAFYGCSNDVTAKERTQNLKDYGIVIDAGHGGQDPGAVSTINGIIESDLNLEIAKKLQSIFMEQGISSSLTRTNENALAETKDEDMNSRRTIIHSSNAPVMVSIHMNSFPDDPNVWGPQVFYCDLESSKELADTLQSLLNEATGGKRKSAYLELYILQGNPMPSVLVECGFISNEVEAIKLSDKEYQALIAQTIADGIYNYCGYKNP